MNPIVDEPRAAVSSNDHDSHLRDIGRLDLRAPARDPRFNHSVPQNVAGMERVVSGLLGGVMLLRGVSKRSVGGLAMLGLGTFLVRRASTGKCALMRALGADTRDMPHQSANPLHRRMRGKASIGVQAEPLDVHAAWRDAANVELFLADPSDEGETVRAPLELELVAESEGSRLVWRSKGDDSPAYGLELTLSALPAGRGTQVDLELDYLPDHGLLGAVVDRFKLNGPRAQAFEALRRAKRHIELGYLPSIDGQSRGTCSSSSNGRSYR